MLLQPRRDVDRVTKVGNLPPRISTFANRHRTGMQSPAKTGYYAEFAKIKIRLLGNPVLDSEETCKIAWCQPLRYPPRHDDFISNIGVYLAAMVKDDPIHIEKQSREKLLHLQIAHPLGERRRAHKIEKQ